MRILVTTQPAFGHLNPLVPLARGLATAGHEVRIASSASFLPQLALTGVPWTTAGVDWLEARPELAFPEMMEHRDIAGKHFLFSEIFCHRTAAPFARDLLAQAELWRPELVIREPWELGGAIAARVLGIPLLVHGIGMLANTTEVLDVGRDRLRQTATTFGITGSPTGWALGEGYVDPCPTTLAAQDDPEALFATVLPIRPSSHHGVTPDAELLAASRDLPLVYVGMGTVMNRRPGLWSELAEAVQDMKARFVFSTGPGHSDMDIGSVPANVIVREFVDLDALLPRCAAVVCHGGWSTTMTALTHGLPLAVIPLGADGPETARRVAASGAGRTVAAHAIQVELPGVLTQLLTDPAIRRRAVEIHDELTTMPSGDEVARQIGGLFG